MRDCFAAPPGYLLLVADFSQLEYRLLAHFTQEPKLIRLFEEGWDLHSLTAYNVFPEIRAAVNMKFGEFTLEASHWIKEEYDDLRKKAKTLNFEIIYGVGHVKLSEQLEIPEHEGKRMIDGWFEGYPHVKRWQKNELAKAAQFGFGKTLAGRYRRVKMERFLSSDRSRRGEEERSFLNALIQGSAADMTKKSMILISRSEELRELGLRMTMQVHDEIVMEIPARNAKAAVPLVRKIMEQPFSQPLRVPMPVSIGVGPTWASAKV
jgi:DNA polymerase-1